MAALVIGGGIALQAPRQPLYLTAQKGTTSGKTSSSSSSESGGGFLDWLLKNLDKESFSETDPILKKVDSGNGASAAKPVKKNAADSPVDVDKKGGLLGGLFSKN